MRAETEIEGSRIMKSVTVSSYLFRVIDSNFNEYRQWLLNSGFRVPDTDISYNDGTITFNQELLPQTSLVVSRDIIHVLQTMNFEKFGIDSNPHNFMGNENPFFVDFFPFLIREQMALEEQFDYPVETVLQRYFVRSNVITAHINRLFKEDFDFAIQTLDASVNLLLQEFDQILPREKDRLLKGIELAHINSDSEEFVKYYYDNKRKEHISEEREVILKSLLEKF